MNRKEELTTQLFRLARIARNIQLKRALADADPDPRINFWRLIYGDCLDIAVLEWCKVFGNDSEPTHWKTIVPSGDREAFRSDLLAHLAIDAAAWRAYWHEMTTYRTHMVAHHFDVAKMGVYPVLELALHSAEFHYKCVIRELRGLGETKYPDDLAAYATDFAKQCREVAKHAVEATKEFEENVY